MRKALGRVPPLTRTSRNLGRHGSAQVLGRGEVFIDAVAVSRDPALRRAAVEIRLLGSLEVLKHGRRVALAGARQRAVLAVLALHANEVVGTERLVDAVWGDEAPLTAAKIVHNNVSQLRRLLEPDTPPGPR